jgi:hypothetical protein
MGEAARIWTTVGANIAPLKAGLAEAGAATNRFGSFVRRAMASHTKQMESFGGRGRGTSRCRCSAPARSRRRWRSTSRRTWR